jgi:hypothetical protein
MRFWKKNPRKHEVPTPEGPFKMSYDKPPVWDSVCLAFKINPTSAIFTYGDTIYNPNKLNLTADLVEHERMHMAQQEHSDEGAALWWGKYLRDADFRIDQEARAYGRQYDVICKVITDRNQRNRVLMDLARILSGPLYNKVVNVNTAMTLIKSFSKLQ